MEKLKDLTLGEKIIGIAAIVLFIDSFLNWYSVSIGGFTIGDVHSSGISVTRNGWQSPGAIWSILAVLLALAMLAQIVITRFELAKLPDNLGGQPWGRVHLIGGIVVLALVIIKWLNEHRDIAYGFWIGLLCGIALVVGGYFMNQQPAESAPPSAPPAAS